MEEDWMSLLIFPINFATYGLACAGVIQWNFSFRFLALAFKRIWRRSEDWWKTLPNWIQWPIYMFIGVPFGLIFFALMIGGGGFGLYLGFEHAKEVKLQASGESYLGQNQVKREDYDRYISYRINLLLRDRDSWYTAEQRAIKHWMLWHWKDNEESYPRPFAEEYCESFVEEFKNLMGEESET